jgi:hypothetical protein
VNTNKKTVTPWGDADTKEIIAPGIIYYTTPSHGGFHLSEERQIAMPEALRLPTPWYGEDIDWARVVCAFPDAFPENERESALKLLINVLPNEYEAWSGKTVEPGMSAAREKMLWQEKHANDYQVYSSYPLCHAPAIILSHATLGGREAHTLPPPDKSIMFLATYPRHPEGIHLAHQLYSPERHTLVAKNELKEMGLQFIELREKCPEAFIPANAEVSEDDPDLVLVTCRRAGYLKAPNEYGRRPTYLRIPDDNQEFIVPADEWFSRDLKKLWTITEDGRLAEGENEQEDDSPSP